MIIKLDKDVKDLNIALLGFRHQLLIDVLEKNNFTNYKKLTNFNYRDVSVKPNIGDLILFPSWLMHGSDNEKNKSNERLVLSFNTKYYENTQNK